MAEIREMPDEPKFISSFTALKMLDFDLMNDWDAWKIYFRSVDARLDIRGWYLFNLDWSVKGFRFRHDIATNSIYDYKNEFIWQS